MILDELGIATGPLLASAGIVGIAVGFGAQALVRDVISGIFMLVEDQYGVGDVVDLGDASGVVEAVGLRVTRVRDVNGTVWYIRNGQVLRVGNQSQGWARAVLDVAIAYGEDVERAESLLLDIANGLRDDEKFGPLVLEEPEMWGIESVTADSRRPAPRGQDPTAAAMGGGPRTATPDQGPVRRRGHPGRASAVRGLDRRRAPAPTRPAEDDDAASRRPPPRALTRLHR